METGEPDSTEGIAVYSSRALPGSNRRQTTTKRLVQLSVLVALLIFVTSVSTLGKYFTADDDSNASLKRARRSIDGEPDQEVLVTQCRNATTVEDSDGGEFPDDLFTMEQLQHGAVVLHVLGVLYLFLAVATVCDEFFVPIMDVIIEKLGISDDVAGATFMAMGASIPELFTATIGVFISHSNVGVGTIVGGASINLLFTVAMCCMFMKGRFLQLTPWPFFRDILFYVGCLLMVFVTFVDQKVYWYEAVLLVVAFCVYVVIMRYNVYLDGKVSDLTQKLQKKLKVKHEKSPDLELQPAKPVEKANGVVSKAKLGPRRPNPMVRRTSIIHRMGMVSKAIGVQQFRRATVASPYKAATANGWTEREAGAKDRRRTVSDMPSRSAPIRRQDSAPRNTLSPIAEDTDTCPVQLLEVHNLRQTSFDIPKRPVTRPDQLPLRKNISDASLEKAAKDSQQPIDESDTEGLPKPLDLSWPETNRERCIYVLMIPILFLYRFSIPDVRNPKWKPWWIVSFSMSVVWLGTLCYFIVWWATTIGDTIGISDEVMGLTLLAAGSNTPDMLNSIIVARRGLADMAVSSSIGGNIISLTIGLHTPWLIYLIVQAAKGLAFDDLWVSVESASLGCSVGLLFVTIVLLVILVIAFRWKIDRRFGSAILAIYFANLTLILLIETKAITCPLSLSAATVAC